MKKAKNKSKDNQSQKAGLQNKSPELFPVAGIGASAGGLEAISKLLEHLPVDLGIAYVIIQHLDPRHTSILPELLEKKTNMPVMKVENNMEIKPDHIYVIPPNTLMTIEENQLILAPRERTDGSVHSIDHFLKALAAACRERAIGIILSGTAMDGTLGVKAIKMEGGITFAQDETARFQGMPRSAADSGCVDYVLPPEGIAKELKSLVKQPVPITTPNENYEANADGIRKILTLVRQKKDIDFLQYKKSTIYRRLMRRLVLTKSKNLEAYWQLLREDDKELDQLYNDLLINVTSFFREPFIHKALEEKMLPALVKERGQSGDPFRVWVAGCASGEEAYSIAICLTEFFSRQETDVPVKIFATDINEAAIEHARRGAYLKNEMQNISPQQLTRFFTKVNGFYQMRKDIRDMCVFAPHNLLRDPPFSNIDVISCRNVLMYLETDAQDRILQAFHYALKPTGYLLLGKSESVSRTVEFFDRADKEYNIYSKKPSSRPLELSFSMPKVYERSAGRNLPVISGDQNRLSLEAEANKILLKNYVPPGVVINKDMDILRFNGLTSRYLEPASGKASLNLLKMAKDELLPDLRRLISQVKKEDSPARKKNIRLKENDHTREITIEVAPLKTSDGTYYLVLFKEPEAPDAEPSAKGAASTEGKEMSIKDRRFNEMEQDLKEAREHIKAMNEDFEATREELQSSNEEILSSNEELQSLNEELETSKEELQSTNEELITVNEELERRNDDLQEARDYAQAIVETVRSPLILLDERMRVRSANKAFYTTFGLTPEETEGRLFYEIGNGQWNIKELNNLLEETILRNKNFTEFEVTQNIPHRGERILLLNAQRLSQDNNRKINILIAMEDVTDRRKMDEVLLEKKKDERFRLLAENAPVMIWIEDTNQNRTYFNNTWLQYRGRALEQETGHGWEEGIHPDDLDGALQVVKNAFGERKKFKQEYRLKRNDGAYRWVLTQGVPLYENGQFSGYMGSSMDINYRVEQEKQKDEFIAVASHELKTPLTSIKIYAELLHHILVNNKQADAAALAAKMDAQVARLITLIKKMLDVSRIEDNSLQLSRENFNINDLITEVVDDMQRTTKTHELIISSSPAANISGDKERISQVLVNFISNAIKYSPGANRVIISSEKKGGQVKVEVRDFGIGIPENVHDKIFDRFFRAPDPHNTFPGMGLGLYISAEIIKRHGGTIGFSSSLGKGSVFWFTLPVKDKIN